MIPVASRLQGSVYDLEEGLWAIGYQGWYVREWRKQYVKKNEHHQSNPTQQQKENVGKKAVEQHHTILFIFGADKYKCGKLIEDMKYDIVQKKDTFPKTVAETCHILSKWKNH